MIDFRRSVIFVGLTIAAAFDGKSASAVEDVPVTWSCTDDSAARYVRWKHEYGLSVAAPIVHQGRLLIGASVSSADDDKKQRDGLGAMLCLSADDGQLLWKSEHARLPKRANDMLGVCSKAAVDDSRVYYQSNRGELMCVDLFGFANGNDGPCRDEKQIGPTDVDIVWKIDMVAELDIFKRDAVDVADPLPCPLVLGDMVYCLTGNGANWGGILPKPEAPSFLAVDKQTGKILWKSNVPGSDICFGQWSSPVSVSIGGQTSVIFPAGDGRLYAFEPKNGKLLWTVDCNEPGALHWRDWKKSSDAFRRLGMRDFFVAVPTIDGSMLYAGLHHELENAGQRQWPVVAVDLKKAAAGESAIRWKYQREDFAGTVGSVAVDGKFLHVFSTDGFLISLDAATGKEVRRIDRESSPAYFNSPTINGKHMFLGTDDGYLYVFATGPEGKCLGRFELDTSVCGTPVVVGDTLYITTYSSAWALRLPEELK